MIFVMFGIALGYRFRAFWVIKLPSFVLIWVRNLENQVDVSI